VSDALSPLLGGVAAAHPYRVEAQYPKDSAWGRFTDADGWIAIVSGSSHYCRGYIDARRESRLRAAHRLRRVRDGRIVEELPALPDAPIGMVAGWPTQRQQIDAAVTVLQRAASPYRDEDEDLTRRARAALAVLETR
jgi:hypothetical protein